MAIAQGPEKRIENQIKRFLDSIGAWHIKTHGNMFSRAGTPDILACINGKFVAIEVKREKGGEVSTLQLAHIKLIQQAGGVAFVASGLEEAKAHLKKQHLI